MDGNPANRPRVLIVEDDHITMRDLEATLKRRGFLVSGANSSGSAARELVDEEKPDVVLLDIKLSGDTDGIELARFLRKERGIPVIFITGYSEDAVFEKARELKPAGFIRKPFSDAELVACLEAVVERNTTMERLELRLPGLQAAASQLDQAVIASDLDGNVVFLNDAALRLTGCSREEALGAKLSEVARIENSRVIVDDADGVSPRGSKVVELVARDGSRVGVEERSAPIKSNDGEALGVVSVFQTPGEGGPIGGQDEEVVATGDIHPARSAALAKVAALAKDPGFKDLIVKRGPGQLAPLPKLEVNDPTTFLQSASPLIEDLGDPLMRISSDGEIMFANGEASLCFGDGKALAGIPFWQCFTSAEFERYDDDFNRPLADGLRHKFDFHDTGRAKWFEVRLYESQGGVMALFHDITVAKIEAAEVIRHQRLEGLGLLARGFAHDFNNHLTTLTGNLSMARERHQEDQGLQNMLKEAQGAATRATNLVQQLMTFARGGKPIREPVRVADLIRRVLGEHRDRHPNIRYQFQGSESELRANLDPSQITRLVENLVTNSEQAMSGGGVLIVRCGRVSPNEVKRIRGSHNPTSEDHLLIEVIDTGEGISESVMGRVFEPYFTLRKNDNATGIGLTVCESIARAHDGFVHLQSKQGKGTIATFCAPFGNLPEAGDDAEKTIQVPSAVSPQTESGPDCPAVRILILEDDAPIRRLMSATLRRGGHEVVETADGSETILEYREALESGNRFDLFISDLTIENGLGGVETMKQIREMDPDVLAIVSSGYSDAAAMANPAAFGFRGVLPKPYAPSQLREIVNQVLASHHAE